MRNEDVSTSVPRAWHVDLADNRGEKILAHACEIRDGCLTFWNHSPQDEHREVLVHAYARHAWRECDLTDTPASPAVQLTAAASIDSGSLAGPRWR